MIRIALFLGKEVDSVRDDKAKITRGGTVDKRVIDLVENTICNRKPDPAFTRDGGADTRFGAGSPVRFDSGITRGIMRHRIIVMSWIGEADSLIAPDFVPRRLGLRQNKGKDQEGG